MGKAAKEVKERRCILCRCLYHTDSAGIKRHFKVCTIATRLGLTLPGRIERPTADIILTDRGEE